MNLKFNVKQPLAVVFDYLTDMQKFVSVHPVIFKINRLDGNNYLVYEKLNFIPFPFTYKVTVTGNSGNGTVTIKALVIKMVKIEMNYTLKELEGFTQINEVIHFETFLPVKSIMGKIFKTQHKKLFMNIENIKV